MTTAASTRSAALPIGIIGCGNIFPAYLKTLQRCRRVRIVAIADANADLAASRAAAYCWCTCASCASACGRGASSRALSSSTPLKA